MKVEALEVDIDNVFIMEIEQHRDGQLCSVKFYFSHDVLTLSVNKLVWLSFNK